METNSNTNSNRSKLWFKVFYDVIRRPEFSSNLRGYPVMRGGRVERNLGKIVPTFFVARSGRVWFRAPEGVWGIQIGREIKHLPDICREIEQEVDYGVHRVEREEKLRRDEEEMMRFISDYRRQELPQIPVDDVQVVKTTRGREHTIYLLSNGWVIYKTSYGVAIVEDRGGTRVEVVYSGNVFQCSCGKRGVCDHMQVVSDVLGVIILEVEGGGYRYDFEGGYTIILSTHTDDAVVEKGGREVYHIKVQGVEDEHLVVASCDCPAGRYGKSCKHFAMYVEAIKAFTKEKGYEPIYGGVQVRWQG